MKGTRILVTGAGGFIGHHLVTRLVDEGHWVRGVDIKRPEFESTNASEFRLADLRSLGNCIEACKDTDQVYHLAADMGGIGYITANHATVARNNILINSNMLEASKINRVKEFLFTSSACIYPQYKQDSPRIEGLKERDAYPADPEPGYGWEKLFAEELCKYYRKDFNLNTRIVRLHNVYGPLGTYDGGKEKAPAAICRKIALAKKRGDIEIWGDGNQTRSFMYIADCIEGLIRIMDSDFMEPINLGTETLISIKELVDLVAKIAGKNISIKFNLDRPQGVRGRNSDNTLLRKIVSWEPRTPLETGLKNTYSWIYNRINGSKNELHKESKSNKAKVAT